MEKKIVLESFTCEENLAQYISSMLFDSGEEIARGTFTCGDKHLEISLRVCGEVAVTYKNEVYHKPSEFPDELIQLIKEHPYDWDVYAPSGEENDEAEGNIYVGLNNWFEYIFDGDSDVYEEDLAERSFISDDFNFFPLTSTNSLKATPGMILDDMFYIARRYFGLEKW